MEDLWRLIPEGSDFYKALTTCTRQHEHKPHGDWAHTWLMFSRGRWYTRRAQSKKAIRVHWLKAFCPWSSVVQFRSIRMTYWTPVTMFKHWFLFIGPIKNWTCRYFADTVQVIIFWMGATMHTAESLTIRKMMVHASTHATSNPWIFSQSLFHRTGRQPVSCLHAFGGQMLNCLK